MVIKAFSAIDTLSNLLHAISLSFDQDHTCQQCSNGNSRCAEGRLAAQRESAEGESVLNGLGVFPTDYDPTQLHHFTRGFHRDTIHRS